jgi:general secretion pathway protein G
MNCMNHHHSRVARGFTLVEILVVTIILGVLAAMVVPKFSNAQSVAKASALKNELRHFRTQAMVYRAQHGVSPGHPGGNPAMPPDIATLADQLTKYTNAKGEVSPVISKEFRYGPYMTQLPVNPINQSSEILFIGANEPLPSSPVGNYGWIYQPATTTIIANASGADELGIAFFDY